MKNNLLKIAALSAVIKIGVLSAVIILSGAQKATSQSNTIELFNGKDLSNWKLVIEDKSVKAEDVFSVKNGVIHIKGTPFGFMATKEKFKNYRLHVEWCWPIEGTNSGIFLYVQDDERAFPNTVECQLCSGDAGDFVVMGGAEIEQVVVPAGEQRPAFARVVRKGVPCENKIGEWNNADITVEDGTITVFINGVYQNTGSKSLHKTGYVGLQSEGKDILFRNVRLTPIQ